MQLNQESVATPLDPPANVAAPVRARLWHQRSGRLLVSLADQGVCSATNFLTSVLVGRSVSETAFGMFGVALFTWLMLTEVGNALVSTPHQVLSPRYKGDELRRFHGSNLLASLAIGVLTMLLLAAGGATVWATGDHAMGQTLLALSLAIGAILTRQFTRQFSFSVHNQLLALAVDSVVALVQLGVLGLLFVTHTISPVRAVLVIGLANGAAMGVFLLAARHQFKLSVRHAKEDARRIWPIAKWLVLSGLVWTVGVHGYGPLVLILSGKANAGAWTACFGIAALANPLLMGLQNLVGPSIARAYTNRPADGFRRYVVKCSVGLGVAMLPFAIFLVFFGDFVVRIFGDHYAGNGLVVGILGVSMLTHAIGFAAARGLMAIHQTRHDVVGNVLALLAMVVAGVPLIITHGVVGAAVSFVVGVVLGNGYRVLAFYQSTQAPRDVEAPMPLVGGAT